MIADWSSAVVVVAAREVIVFGEGGGEGNEVGCAVIAPGRWVGEAGTTEEGDGIAVFVVEDGELMRCNKERSETDPLFARCGGVDGAAAVEHTVVPDKGTLGDEDGDVATATSVPVWPSKDVLPRILSSLADLLTPSSWRVDWTWECGWGTGTPVAAAGEVACETSAGLAAGVLVLLSGRAVVFVVADGSLEVDGAGCDVDGDPPARSSESNCDASALRDVDQGGVSGSVLVRVERRSRRRPHPEGPHLR
ncbi:BQ5605_C003g02231 [Microbotryum silenes-dioicae]|uniref:BQ5605_C003g02231 protein n=1 Tax=Microbotryum silenes-dioicae TaxID=796604 RepID=A0A2X0P3V8_9BASI|nr:BQ5605_C003g02231 [Microbotryum silenes-dioicae]